MNVARKWELPSSRASSSRSPSPEPLKPSHYWPFQLPHYTPEIFAELALPESRNNQTLIRFNPISNAISVATSEMLVIYLTSQDILDYDLLSDFFLTFRLFMSPHLLLELLVGRMAWAVIVQSSEESLNEVGRDVSVRTFVMLRHWILNFFPDDFVPSYDLRVCFSGYINTLYSWDLAQNHTSFLLILNQLKKCWLRSCNLYWNLKTPDAGTSTPAITPAAAHPVPPGGSIGSNVLPSQPATRRTTLLSMYKVPIKPVLSNSEFTDAPPQVDQTHLLSMMGSLIKGGISLSTDVEVKSIKPPTPVKSMGPGIPMSLDINPRKKSQRSIRSIVDTWKREFGLHKDKAISKFFSKIVNVSDPKKSDAIKLLHMQSSARESEQGKVRIDILSARVIEELDNILKYQGLSTPSSATASRQSTSRPSSSVSRVSTEPVVSSPIPDTITNDTSFGSSSTQKHQDKSPNHLLPSPLMNRVSLIDNMDIRSKFRYHDGSDDISVHKSPILLTTAPSHTGSSFDVQWDSESDISVMNAPSPGNLNTLSFHSMKSFDSYDSQFTADSRNSQYSPESPSHFGLRRMKDNLNLKAETQDISPTRNSTTSSFFSNDIAAVHVSITAPRESISRPTGHRTARALHVFKQPYYYGDDSSSSLGKDSFFNNGHNAMTYSGVNRDAVAELANIPDDVPDDDAIEAALRKLEGTYVKHDNAPPTPVLSDSSPTPKSKPHSFPPRTPTKSFNIRTSAVEYSENHPPSSPPVPIFSHSNDTSLYNGAFETPTKKLPIMDGDKTPKPSDTLRRRQLPSLNIKVGQPERITAAGIIRSPQDPLSVASSVPHGNHTPFILNFSSSKLTEQFTLIERDALAEIDWKELIELQWNQKLNPIQSWLGYLVERNATGVEVVITRFNLMVNWIKSEILLTQLQRERAQTISRFIHVAHHSRRLQNYSTMMQIVLALSSSTIKKLKRTWQNVPLADTEMLESLEQVVSPFRNFQRLRAEFNSLDTSIGCIPFLGVYLSDLTYNAERPAYVSANSGPATERQSGSLSPAQQTQQQKQLVNFDRFRMSASVVKSLIQCIEWSSNYKFTADQDLLAKCLYIQSLTDDEMNTCYQYLDGEY